MLAKYEQVTAEFGEEHVMKQFDPEELMVIREFLDHGRQIRTERERAKRAGEEPNFVPLVRGSTSVRKQARLCRQSPARHDCS